MAILFPGFTDLKVLLWTSRNRFHDKNSTIFIFNSFLTIQNINKTIVLKPNKFLQLSTMTKEISELEKCLNNKQLVLLDHGNNQKCFSVISYWCVLINNINLFTTVDILLQLKTMYWFIDVLRVVGMFPSLWNLQVYENVFKYLSNKIQLKLFHLCKLYLLRL